MSKNFLSAARSSAAAFAALVSRHIRKLIALGTMGLGAVILIVSYQNFSIPPDTYVKVALGANNGCGITSTGALKCWSQEINGNQFGEVGNGTKLPVTFDNPATIVPSGATDVALSPYAGCAVVSGALKCWGTFVHSGPLARVELNPVTIIASGVTQVALDRGDVFFSGCAVVGGAAKCFGVFDYVSIGFKLGPIQDPATIISSGVTQVSIHAKAACAVVAGALKCWGNNPMAELSSDTNNVPYTAPKTVFASGVTQVSMDRARTCALVSGDMKCWGGVESTPLWITPSGLFDLGDGLRRGSATPVTSLSGGVSQIQIGGSVWYTNCAIQNGQLICFSGGVGSGFNLDKRVVVQSGASSFAIGVQPGFICAIVYGKLVCDRQESQVKYWSTQVPVCSSSVSFECNAVANGRTYRVTSDSSLGNSGTCVVSSCNPSFHVENAACVADTRNCVVRNSAGAQIGSGVQTWTTSGWPSACRATSCSVGYQLSNGTCSVVVAPVIERDVSGAN